jgi:2-polyprenyl-6-methoxyphenol hydroxylase-like FAD-dependent oxidoreductase
MKICLVGSGMSMYYTAISLMKHGHDITCIYEEEKHAPKDSRTTVLWQKNVDMLAKYIDNKYLDSLEKIDFVSSSIDDQVFDISAKDANIDYLAKVAVNHDLYQEIYNVYKAIDCKKIFKPYSHISLIENDYLSLIVNNENHAFDKILIFDNKFFQNTEIKPKIQKYNYHEDAIVFNIKHKNHHNNTAYEIFEKNSIIATIPLNNNTSNVIWSLDSRISDAVSDENIEKYLHKMPYRLGKCEVVSKISRFNLGFAQNYIKSKDIILCGSALRSMHPLAGQAFNLIMRDTERMISSFNKTNQGQKNSYIRNSIIDDAITSVSVHLIDKIPKYHNGFSKSLFKIGFMLANKSSFIKNKVGKYSTGNSIFNFL